VLLLVYTTKYLCPVCQSLSQWVSHTRINYQAILTKFGTDVP
jgi:hypothetical protein